MSRLQIAAVPRVCTEQIKQLLVGIHNSVVSARLCSTQPPASCMVKSGEVRSSWKHCVSVGETPNLTQCETHSLRCFYFENRFGQ